MTFSPSKALITRVLVTLTLAVAGIGGLTAIAEAADCFSCHAPDSTTDIRPVEAAYRNITTGSIVGNHAKHIPAQTTDTNQCTACHGTAAASYTPNHRDGFIIITSATTAPSLTYSKGTRFPQSGAKIPNLGTCSTATCHANVYGAGSAVTPVWGTNNNGCAACHTQPITALGPGTGSHTSMVGHAVVCTYCHAAGTAQTSMPSVGHNDGDIDVLNVGYSTLNKPKGSAGGTCSAADCHANVYGAGIVVTPAWGTSGNGCSACHSTPITPTGPATGSHTSMVGHAVGCIECHNAGTTQTTSPGVGHADGDIDIVNVGYQTLNKPKGTAGGTCSTAYCHANVYGAGTTVTPAWGSTGNGCAACHTGANVITAFGPGTGSHTEMVGHAVTCTYCHSAGTSPTTLPNVNHFDGDIDVVGVGYSTLNKPKGSAGGTCSAASCHANVYGAGAIVTPAWGSTGNGCAACHTGANIITANGPGTGSHTSMISHAVACTYCHAAGTSQSTVPGVNHADGDIDVVNVGYSTLNKPKGSAYGTCSATVCHGSSSPAWGTDTGNAVCTKCHGTGTATVTAANYHVVAPSDPTALDNGHVSANPEIGAHQTHLQYFNGLTGQGADEQARCAACHGTLPSSGSHANGTVALNFTYSAGSCSNTSCHNPAANGLMTANAGSNTAPSWTNASYLDNGGKNQANCGKCHKVPGDAGFTKQIAHATMVTDNLPANNCTSCHGHEGDASGGVGMRHMDGVFGVSAECNSCHGYPPMTQAQLDARAGSYVDAGLQRYNEGGGHHQSHLLGSVLKSEGFTPCLPCHPSSSHNEGNGTVLRTNVQVNAVADAGYRFDDNRFKRYDVAAQTCSNISCHFQPTPAW